MLNYVEPIKKISDINKIIQYFKKRDFKYCTIFVIGIYSGLRISDILNLNISDVENKTELEIKEKKTGKYKRFPLNEQCQNYIKHWLVIRKKQWANDEKKPLFVGKKHCRLERSQVYRKINEACFECGIIGNFGTHTMRKTFGYHHYQQFHDVALLQKIFNHSSPSITLRYIGIEQEEINQSYKNFSYKGVQEDITPPIEEKKEEEKTKSIIEFLQNYLKNGGVRHREFAELALASEVG